MSQLKQIDEVQTGRQYRIGASEVSTIIGDNPYQSAFELWLVKTNRVEAPDLSKNEAVQLGIRLEPILLDIAYYELGPIERNLRLYSPDDETVSAQIDSRVIATGDIVDAKTYGLMNRFHKREYGDESNEEVPLHVWEQLQIQLNCSPQSKLARVYALVGGEGVKRYEIKPDVVWQKEAIKYCVAWWEQFVIGDVQPEIMQPVDNKVLSRIRRTKGDVIDLPMSALDLVNQLVGIRKDLKQLESLEATCKTKLIAMLGDAEYGRIPGMDKEISYKETQRKGFTVEPTSFRQLRLPRGME